ncbi:MAG: GGGtGRT protein, partial [Candidatus Fimadaptatus sp.]
MVRFENYERRIGQIMPVLEKYGFKDLEDARDFCLSKGIDCESIVHGIQPI